MNKFTEGDVVVVVKSENKSQIGKVFSVNKVCIHTKNIYWPKGETKGFYEDTLMMIHKTKNIEIIKREVNVVYDLRDIEKGDLLMIINALDQVASAQINHSLYSHSQQALLAKELKKQL